MKASDRIHAYLAARPDAQAEESDLDPLAAGLLDSLEIEQLITFCEGEFGMEFADDELTMENFATVDDLAALVTRKHAARAGS